jgi:hypothetical protein
MSMMSMLAMAAQLYDTGHVASRGAIRALRRSVANYARQQSQLMGGCTDGVGFGDAAGGRMQGKGRHRGKGLIPTPAGLAAAGLIAAATLVAGCSLPGSPSSPTPIAGTSISAGGDACGLLGPADFAAAGIAGAQPVSENTDGLEAWFCNYSGQTDASSNIELDAFTGGTAAYGDLASNNQVTTDDATAELGADRAGTNMNGPGYMAVIVACKGKLCFDITLPASSAARDDLITLARLVLQRGSALTR